jgi:AraC family transcriptional regulator
MNVECKRAGQVGYMDFFPTIDVPRFDMEGYNKRFHEANVIIDAKTKSVYYGDHWSSLSVKCAANGAEFYKVGDATYRVDDDYFLIFNEGKEYSSWIDSKSEVESFTLNLSPAFERQAFEAICSMATGLIENPRGGDKIRFTERLYHRQPRMSAIIASMRLLARNVSENHLALQELFFALYQEMIHLQNSSDREAMTTCKVSVTSRIELFRRLVRARDFMHSCYDKELSLKDIAQVACLNPYYFLREFRKAFTSTPHQYLTQRRISEARKILSTGHATIADVCMAVGFSDQSSFSKLFRRHTGQTPTDFVKAASRSSAA